MKITNIEKLTFSRRERQIEKPWIAIIGNPNCGKTALFNRLTGLHQKVGNYPGITVEKKEGKLRNSDLMIRDLPGTYSLEAKSRDEQIVTDLVQSWRNPQYQPRAVVVVLDSTNLSRNIYLALQILEFNVPTILVLNMIDEARKKGLFLNTDLLRQELQAYRVIETSAKTGEGVNELAETLNSIELQDMLVSVSPKMQINGETKSQLEPLAGSMAKYNHILHLDPIVDSIRYLSNPDYANYLFNELTETERAELEKARDKAEQKFQNLPSESVARYQFIDDLVQRAVTNVISNKKTLKETLDSALMHPVLGFVFLFLILGFIFNAIFSWSQPPMGWIESAVDWLTKSSQQLIPPGPINSLFSEGIIPGVGNVIVFLPQIILLAFFIALLEDSGYMSRMAFLLDKVLRKFGLQGKAVLPMLSGFACAIPAIMAARTIENWRDRLITIMLIPLISCSARLPVYTLLISAFVPQQTMLGFIQLQSLVLLGVYFLGFFTAILVSSVIKYFSSKRQNFHFIMEMPPYRLPLAKSVGWKVYNSAKLFLVNAGSIILAISVIIWFLASFPKTEQAENLTPSEKVEQSYAGQLGHAIEPVIKPLGFDWKIGIGLISSFAAREVIISSFATIYNLGEDTTEESLSLRDALRNDRNPDGTAVYSTLTAISLLVFFVFAAQCMSTFAIVKRETASWKWPIVMVVYMTALAYGASLVVYQGGNFLGLV